MSLDQRSADDRRSPVPRRWSRPRWINLRVVTGLLLVIGSVVVGARVLAAGDETTSVWVATADLASGTVVTAADLRETQVRLADSTDRYLLVSSSSPVNQVLNRPVSAGELIPAQALGVPEEGRVVVLPIEPERLPAGVDHGSVVDVYLAPDRGATGETGRVVLLLAGVTVQGVEAEGTGLSAVGSTVQVSVALTPDQASALLTSMTEGSLVLALVTGR